MPSTVPMSSMSTSAPLDPAQFSLCRHGHPVQNGEIFLELQGACNKACLLLLPPCTLTLMLSTMAPLIYLLKYFNKTASAHSGYRRYLYHQGNEKTTGGTVEAAAKPWLIPAGKYFAAHRPQGQHPLQGVLPLRPVREWRRRHWRRRSPVSGVWLLLATRRSPVSGTSPHYHYMTLPLHTLPILK